MWQDHSACKALVAQHRTESEQRPVPIRLSVQSAGLKHDFFPVSEGGGYEDKRGKHDDGGHANAQRESSGRRVTQNSDSWRFDIEEKEAIFEVIKTRIGVEIHNKVFSYDNDQGNNAWFTRVAHPVKEVLKMDAVYMARHGDDVDARFGQHEMGHLRKWWKRQRDAHKKFKRRAMETGSSGGREGPKPTYMMQLREECFDYNHAVAKKAIMPERLRENPPTNLRLSEEGTGRSTSTGARVGGTANVHSASGSGSGSRRGGGGSSGTHLTGGPRGGTGSGNSGTTLTAGRSWGSGGSRMGGGGGTTSRGGKGKGRLVHRGNNPRVSSSDGMEEGREYDVPAGGGATDSFGDWNESECDWLPTDEETEEDHLRSSRGGGDDVSSEGMSDSEVEVVDASTTAKKRARKSKSTDLRNIVLANEKRMQARDKEKREHLEAMVLGFVKAMAQSGGSGDKPASAEGSTAKEDAKEAWNVSKKAERDGYGSKEMVKAAFEKYMKILNEGA